MTPQNPQDTLSENTEAASPQEKERKPPKGIYMLPNLVTLAALFGGFYAVVMAMNVLRYSFAYTIA